MKPIAKTTIEHPTPTQSPFKVEFFNGIGRKRKLKLKSYSQSGPGRPFSFRKAGLKSFDW